MLLITICLAGLMACSGNNSSANTEEVGANKGSTALADSREKVTSTNVHASHHSNASGFENGESTSGKEIKNTSDKGNDKVFTSKPENNTLIYGITIGFMDLIFKKQGNTIILKPEAEKALAQIKKDGFIYIRMMEPFPKGYMDNFPAIPVKAVKLLKDMGFKVLLSINGSPFINGATDSEDKWIYRYFPGGDAIGRDDDGGLNEHKKRLRKFMDELKKENLIQGMQFQLFNEPNSKNYFWGTYPEFLQLLDANIEILTDPDYGISKKDILFCPFTSKLMLFGNKAPQNQLEYWQFAKSHKNNPKYNQFPFSFHWYPASGNPEKDPEYNAADIKLKPMPEGSWITEMNVSAYMTQNNLLGKGSKPGFRSRNTFRNKLEDIDSYGKANHLAGIYIFNLITRKDSPDDQKGRISTGLFNSKGCPRYEYKVLLEFLNKPVNFEFCPEPQKTEF